jgi:hypothetical protein
VERDERPAVRALIVVALGSAATWAETGVGHGRA